MKNKIRIIFLILIATILLEFVFFRLWERHKKAKIKKLYMRKIEVIDLNREQAKKKIIYDPDVVVFHHRRSLFFKHFRQLASYALHRGYFVRKFPRTSRKIPYFLPSLLIITALVMGLLTVPCPFVRPYYVALLAIYGLLVLATAIKTMNYKLIPPVFLGIIATHITYGLYFAKGLIARKMPDC